MGKWVKRVLGVVVVGFVLFYVINQPQGAADTVHGIIAWLGQAVNSLITFVTALSG